MNIGHVNTRPGKRSTKYTSPSPCSRAWRRPAPSPYRFADSPIHPAASQVNQGAMLAT